MAEQPATDRCGGGWTVHARAAVDDGDVCRLHPRPAMGGAEGGDWRGGVGDVRDIFPIILFCSGAGADLESDSIESETARRAGWDERGGGGADSGGVDHPGTRVHSRRGHAGDRCDLPGFAAEMECEFNLADHWVGGGGMDVAAIFVRVDGETSDSEIEDACGGRMILRGR